MQNFRNERRPSSILRSLFFSSFVLLIFLPAISLKIDTFSPHLPVSSFTERKNPFHFLSLPFIYLSKFFFCIFTSDFKDAINRIFLRFIAIFDLPFAFFVNFYLSNPSFKISNCPLSPVFQPFQGFLKSFRAISAPFLTLPAIPA